MTKRQYSKYSEDWNKENKSLAGKQIEIDKLFKKGEKKPDGTEVTKDDGETIKVKVNDFEELVKERETLITKLDEKKENLKNKAGYTKPYALVSKKHDELETNLKGWKAYLKTANATVGRTNDGNYTNQYSSFLKSGTGITNPYGGATNGWIKLISDYNAKKTTPAGSTTSHDYTNLYEVNFYTGNGHQKQIKMTEQEMIKVITRTLKELEKIDTAGFATKTNTPPTGLSNPLSFTTTAPNAGAVQAQLATLKGHAKKLVETTDKHTGRKEYSFGHNYVDASGNAMVDTIFGKTEIETFFDFIEFIGKNSSWVNHADVKSKVLKDIQDKTELTFIPAQTTSFTEGKLHGWGQENYLDKQYKNSNKATGFYGDIPKSEWEDKAVKYEFEGGIWAWQQLISSGFQTSYNLNEGRLQKIINSFDNNPVSTFLSNYRGIDEFGSFSDGATPAHYYTLYEFPDHAYNSEIELHGLKAEKDALLDEVKTGRKDLVEAEKEVTQVKKDLKDKETEIEAKIIEAIKVKRAELKTKFGIDDTTTNNFEDDNKIEYSEHIKFLQLIKDIRFLVNGDEEKPTGKANEETAYTASKGIFDSCSSFYHSISSFNSIGFTTGESDETTSKRTTEDRIKIIQENKDGKFDGRGLEYWHSQIEELEKQVKLTAQSVEIKKKLKEAIDKQDPVENMKEWQDNLKLIEAGLETAFTQEKIDEWKKKKEDKDAFNNLTSINTLLKDSVIYDETAKKPKEDFITWLKGKDAKLTNLENLIKEKSPKEVITLIHRYKYNKLDDTKKKEYNNKFGQHKEKKGKDGKYLEEYTPTEDELKDGKEFDTFLYEVAIEKLKLTSIEKKTDETNDDNGNDNKKQDKQLDSWWKFGKGNYAKPLLTYGLIFVGIIGIFCVIFWKGIKEWWNGPIEEESGSSVESDEKESED